MMKYDVTPVIQAIIALCATLITVFLIPWIKEKAGSQGLENMLAWVKIAVAAAEQIYTSAQGDEKKQYVLEFLESKGIVVDDEIIDNAIEAAVLELHNNLYGTGKVS